MTVLLLERVFFPSLLLLLFLDLSSGICAFRRVDKSLCACVRPGAQRKLTSGTGQAYANAVQSIRDRSDEQSIRCLMLLGAFCLCLNRSNQIEEIHWKTHKIKYENMREEIRRLSQY